MSSDSLGSIAATIGGGFFAGLVTGWALKKVIKLAAVAVGVFLAALIYLQSQTIVNINWDKLNSVSEATLSTIGNSISDTGAISTVLGHLGLPLTGGLSAGLVIGFTKG